MQPPAIAQVLHRHPQAHRSLRASLATLALLLAPVRLAPAQEAAPTTTPAADLQANGRPFHDRSGSFRIDLPADWRQLAPGETNALRRAVPTAPRDLTTNEPTLFYAVGPVDRWLRGDFDGVYLYVVEQDNEWVADPQLAERLREMWRRKGEHDGTVYAVEAVHEVEVGRERHPAVTCQRSIRPAAGRPQFSFDVHVPTGGRQLTLAFTCWAEDVVPMLPRFQQMLETLSLARRARGETKLTDRLWTPLITGGLVGLVFILLYRHTHRPRD